MRAHYLQHVPFEGLGSIETWLDARGWEITSTSFFESVALPDPTAIAFLIVMGGPMGVHDQADFPWLVAEKQFIRRCIDAKKPVLGICLGAQLIAAALGARVYANGAAEIGWWPIQGLPSAGSQVFQFPRSSTVFHWHGDTFDLPEGAIHLAQSDACQNQAFQLGRAVIGLQFHLETTPVSTRALIAHCGADMRPQHQYIQSKQEILAAPPEQYEDINQVMSDVLDFLTSADFLCEESLDR